MNDLKTTLTEKPIADITAQYPQTAELLANYNLAYLAQDKTIPDALTAIPKEELEEFGLTADELIERLFDFLTALYAKKEASADVIRTITIIGGQSKSGEQEDITLTISAGEIVSIVGPTGSGKSRLLADIECLAQGDTPTKRTILVNDKPLTLQERFRMGTHLVAQLSQNMNFILDISVAEFLEMHAKSRLIESSASVIDACFDAANDLAGEPFTRETKVTQLSGGQSRALMIADTAYISESPIVLIDEIENAGVDRERALSVLTKNDKIVLISTHDPLLALRANRRIVIKNGGMSDIIETSDEEKSSLAHIEALRRTLSAVQHDLRTGRRIDRIPE
ncbi:MAG: ATP-binding cassette domain-containing protein [Selenomonadales bacterium]|nr:ATP-binding cassette domain-containing protein [Selenomonadales bacterium]